MTTKQLNATINIRVDAKTKKKAQKILEEIGLDLTSGIKLFLKTVNRTHSIPFELRTENGFTHKQEMEMIKEAKDALENGKVYDSVDEMFDDILK